ncbi:MAG: BREX system Lon protease-like protein BrxL [Methanoculleus sp.]
MTELDTLDRLVADVFGGYVVRKDLAQKFKGNYPVPTYVAEFLIGKYCATTDDEEIVEGLEIVQRQLGERIVRAGEQELYKAQAKVHGNVKVIDLITARLDARSDSFLATIPSLLLNDVHISSDLVYEHERMLTGGFYAEIELAYGDPESNRPFSVMRLRPIQLSKRNVLDDVALGREKMSDREWKDILIRSVGMEPSSLSQRAQDVLFLRMVPFVEKGYNMIELAPGGPGRATSTSRSAPTPISSLVARQRSPRCS